jgi:phage terminase small subunit
MPNQPLKSLKPRHRVFVDEYLVDLHGRNAAIRAGYSQRYAGDSACRLLADPLIARAVQEAMDKRAQRTRVSADKVLQEYARIAFADIRHFTERKGEDLTIRPPETLDDDDAAAVAEISLAGGAKVKLHDKARALFALARHLGLFEHYLRPPGNPEFQERAGESARAKLRAQIEAYAKDIEEEKAREAAGEAGEAGDTRPGNGEPGKESG